MKKSAIALLSLLLMFCISYAFAAKTEIIFLGNVQSVDLPDEGVGLNGASFLALHKINDTFSISRAVLTFGSSSEVIEIFSSKPNTIALIRNVSINPGVVQTAAADFQVTEKAQKLSLGERTYFVRETKKGLLLGGPDGESIIISNRVDFYIFWAGDLDRDGKLDLIVSSKDGDEKNSESCLLLSSIAKSGKLVEQSACQSYSG